MPKILLKGSMERAGTTINKLNIISSSQQKRVLIDLLQCDQSLDYDKFKI
jgi:hypothetical protein